MNNPNDRLLTPNKQSDQRWYVRVLKVLWVILKAIWIGLTWVTPQVLDFSLWVIMAATENARAVKPTRRISFPDELRDEIAYYQGYKCMYCGIELNWNNLEIDHKFPIDRGGSNDRWNLQALCLSCNRRKGIHSDEEFRARYWELLWNRNLPPSTVIPQNQFNAVTRNTEAHPDVQEARRNRWKTPRQRLGSASIVIVIGGTFIIAVLGGTWFPSWAGQALYVGLFFSIGYTAGLWIRAFQRGIL